MSKLKDYLLTALKRKSTYFLAGTVVLNMIALILYMNFGVSVFVPKLSEGVIALTVLGMVLPLFVAFSPAKIAYVALYIVDLFACFEYLASQASFITNVFVGIDGTSFPPAFIVFVLFTLISAVLSLVAMIFVKEDDGRKKKPAKADATQEEAENESI